MKSSALCSFAPTFLYSNHKILTFASLNFCSISCWHSFVEEYGSTILITLARKLSMPIHSHSPCHDALPFPMRENDTVVLFGFTSKGLNISDVQICSSTFSTYPYQKLQQTTLLTLDGYIPSKPGHQAGSWLQKQVSTLSNTLIRLFMVASWCVMLLQMRIVTHNGILHQLKMWLYPHSSGATPYLQILAAKGQE